MKARYRTPEAAAEISIVRTNPAIALGSPAAQAITKNVDYAAFFRLRSGQRFSRRPLAQRRRACPKAAAAQRQLGVDTRSSVNRFFTSNLLQPMGSDSKRSCYWKQGGRRRPQSRLVSGAIVLVRQETFSRATAYARERATIAPANTSASPVRITISSAESSTSDVSTSCSCAAGGGTLASEEPRSSSAEIERSFENGARMAWLPDFGRVASSIMVYSSRNGVYAGSALSGGANYAAVAHSRGCVTRIVGRQAADGGPIKVVSSLRR